MTFGPVVSQPERMESSSSSISSSPMWGALSPRYGRGGAWADPLWECSGAFTFVVSRAGEWKKKIDRWAKSGPDPIDRMSATCDDLRSRRSFQS